MAYCVTVHITEILYFPQVQDTIIYNPFYFKLQCHISENLNLRFNPLRFYTTLTLTIYAITVTLLLLGKTSKKFIIRLVEFQFYDSVLQSDYSLSWHIVFGMSPRKWIGSN